MLLTIVLATIHVDESLGRSKAEETTWLWRRIGRNILSRSGSTEDPQFRLIEKQFGVEAGGAVTTEYEDRVLAVWKQHTRCQPSCWDLSSHIAEVIHLSKPKVGH